MHETSIEVKKIIVYRVSIPASYGGRICTPCTSKEMRDITIEELKKSGHTDDEILVEEVHY